MKLITSYGRRYYGYRREQWSPGLEALNVFLYAVACGCFFVASGRYFPEFQRVSRERVALLIAGAVLVVLVNLGELINVLGKIFLDRPSGGRPAHNRSDVFVAILMIGGGTATAVAGALALSEATGTGRLRETYDAAFFFVAATIVNAVFHVDLVKDETGRDSWWFATLTKAILAFQAVSATSYACGTLLHATMTLDGCASGFLIGSYFLFVSSALCFLSALLHYFRIRILQRASHEGEPRPLRSTSTTTTTKKKKKATKAPPAAPNSPAARAASFTSRLLGSWTSGSSRPLDEELGSDDEYREDIKPQKKPKTKSRRTGH